MRNFTKKTLDKLEKAIYILLAVIIAASILSLVLLDVRKTKICEIIEEFATENEIDAQLVRAVVKAESNFNPKAVSRANAKGLMQISDKTAEYIAEMLGESEYEIFDERINIKFGCYYIKYLSKKFVVLETMLAAYNAGESNVFYWLSNPEYSDDGKTLKVVPFQETRGYVEKVVKYYIEYKN